MQEYKYGGTSVGPPERMRNIVELLKGRKTSLKLFQPCRVPLDKLGQITNLLYEGLKKEASEECEALRDIAPAVFSGDL